MRRTMVLIAAISTLGAWNAFAEVQAIMLHVTPSAGYTVPSDKVLVIQNVQGPESTAYMNFVNGTTTNTLSFRFFLQEMANDTTRSVVHYPLLVPSSTAITVTYGDWNIFGLLVDPSDLYVSLEHEIDQMAGLADGSVNFGLLTQTAHPLRFQVYGANDLDGHWSVLRTAVVRPQTDKKRYGVTVPLASSHRYFYRTRAYRR